MLVFSMKIFDIFYKIVFLRRTEFLFKIKKRSEVIKGVNYGTYSHARCPSCSGRLV